MSKTPSGSGRFIFIFRKTMWVQSPEASFKVIELARAVFGLKRSTIEEQI